MINSLVLFNESEVGQQFRPNSKEEKLFRAIQNFLANMAKTSRRKYIEAIKDFFDYSAVASPECVKFEDVIAYKEHLKTRELSACTISLRISALRSLYSHLHDENLLTGNVFIKCRLPKVTTESRASCLTKEQAKALLSAPDRSTLIGMRDHLILSLLLYNVLRRGAIPNINKGDFKQEGEHYVLWYVNKGDEIKKTKLQPILADTFKEYLVYLFEKGLINKSDDSIFIRLGNRGKGKRITDQTVYVIVKKYAAKAGLEIHPHELRHTGITIALDNGAKIEKVQNMAAHRSIQTTLRYYRNKSNLDDHGTDYIDLV